MSKLELVQQSILELTKLEQQQLELWFEQLHQSMWDEQLEQDLEAGRLDALINEARADFRAGRTLKRL